MAHWQQLYLVIRLKFIQYSFVFKTRRLNESWKQVICNSEENKMNQNSTQKGMRSFVVKTSNSIKFFLALTVVSITIGNNVIAQNTNLSKLKNFPAKDSLSEYLNGDSMPANNFASIGDYVWVDNNINGIQDPGEPGMPNVEVVLYDSLLNIIDSKYTDNIRNHQCI